MTTGRADPPRVIEIAGGPASGFGGMLLAALGADVVRIDPPAGGSFETSPTAAIDEATRAYLGRRKRSVRLDLRTDAGVAAAAALAARSDAMLEDLGVEGIERLGLEPSRLLGQKPELVIARIAPFGHTGPRAGWNASELVLQAMGGIVHSTGFVGEAGLRVAGIPAHFIAGIHAATAVLAGVLGVRAGTEVGAEISISMEETYLHHWVRHIQQWAYSGHGMVREERGNGRQGFPHTVMASDDWLYVLALNAEWESFATFLGLEQFVTHEWTDSRTRVDRWEDIEPHYRASIASKTREEWFAEAATMGYTFAPIHSVLQLKEAAQFEARGAFEPLEVDGRVVAAPDLPARARMAPPRPNRPPVPGEHTAEVLADAGLSPEGPSVHGSGDVDDARGDRP